VGEGGQASRHRGDRTPPRRRNATRPRCRPALKGRARNPAAADAVKGSAETDEDVRTIERPVQKPSSNEPAGVRSRSLGAGMSIRIFVSTDDLPQVLRMIKEAAEDIDVAVTVSSRTEDLKFPPHQSPATHMQRIRTLGSWVDVKARAECSRCNGGWTRQIEESVSLILPELITGQQKQLSFQDQQAL